MKLCMFLFIIVSCSAARVNYFNSRSRTAKNERYYRNASSSPAVAIHLAPVTNTRSVENLFAMSMPKSSYDVPLKTVTQFIMQRTQKPTSRFTGLYNQQGFKIDNIQNTRADLLKRGTSQHLYQTSQMNRGAQTGNLQNRRGSLKANQQTIRRPQFWNQQNNNNQNINQQIIRGTQNGNRQLQQGLSTNHQHLGAEFEGPKRTPSFDSKTGYHY